MLKQRRLDVNCEGKSGTQPQKITTQNHPTRPKSGFVLLLIFNIEYYDDNNDDLEFVGGCG